MQGLRAVPPPAVSHRLCSTGARPRRVGARTWRVQVVTASAGGKPDYSAVEFDMPWSQVLVPEGPWEQVDG